MTIKLKIIPVIILTFLFNHLFSIAQDTKNIEQTNTLIVSETSDTITCLNVDRSTSVLKKNPEKVISCYTSFVSLWYLAGGKLIAIPNTKHKNLLIEPYNKLELIGSVTSPNVEKIISLKPDLVLLSAQMEKHWELREILKSARINSLLLDYNNYYDFLTLSLLFSKINGKEIDNNQELKTIINDINSIIDRAQKNRKIRFLSIFASAIKANKAETSEANTALIAKLLGAENIIDNLKIKTKSINIDLSMEKIFEQDPDIILITTMGDEKIIQEKMRTFLKNDPLWSQLSAIKKDRFYFLPNELFLYKANENYPEAFKIIYQILYEDKK
ncbi:MAG TPA: ABC transporter substrate-binding protein [Victivallales bacterium]|nr:ABC transporter substrate-binding protein [Victivallales bacterium]HPO90369.1 ABC transporter substrate-binding protein [Victivallales bacterium]HRR27935.1 ABC transporter substrate-binding protein [Victivallales bacterium]HRU00790.1 ABC transporter substrate-binding protein [Victivallales bacterium]